MWPSTSGVLIKWSATHGRGNAELDPEASFRHELRVAIDAASRRLNGDRIEGLRKETYAEPVASGGSIHERAGPPLKKGIERLRAVILDSNDGITEHVKGNAPSFCYAGEDRVTFGFFPEDRAQLILHRGSKPKDDTDTFAFDDDTGLLRWVATGRAVVALRDAEARQRDLVSVVNRWIAT
jgi:hypothetical protein